jgi:elongator complex protein 6
VSFLRDLVFWREGLARLGVDLEGAAARKGMFGFVDGLGVFLDHGGGGGGVVSGQQQQQQTRTGTAAGWRRALTSAAPGEIARVILEGVEALKRGPNDSKEDTGRKVVLVLDGLDFVLAASDPEKRDGSGSGTALALKEMLMNLREVP